TEGRRVQGQRGGLFFAADHVDDFLADLVFPGRGADARRQLLGRGGRSLQGGQRGRLGRRQGGGRRRGFLLGREQGGVAHLLQIEFGFGLDLGLDRAARQRAQVDGAVLAGGCGSKALVVG